MAWSPDSQLLATVNENMPHAVWVWYKVARATRPYWDRSWQYMRMSMLPVLLLLLPPGVV